MTYCNREETSAPSEAYYAHLESQMYSSPLPQDWTQDWTQPIDFSQAQAVDSSSECCSLDSQDSGYGPYFSPSLSSQSGLSESAMDYSTLSQSEAHFSLDSVMPSQDSVSLDRTFWRHSVHGSVDQGFSPTHDYACQSSAVRLPVSQQEPPSYQLPGPYLPYELHGHGSFMGTSPEVSPHTTPEVGYSFEQAKDGCLQGPRSTTDIVPFPGSLQGYYLASGQLPHPGYFMAPALAPAPAPSKRLLAPRTEAAELATQPTFGSQRVLRPQIHGAHRPSVSSVVSNATGLPQDVSRDAVSPVVTTAPALHAMSSVTASSVACVVDPVEHQFNTFVRFDQDDQAISEYSPYKNHGHHYHYGASLLDAYQVPVGEQVVSPSTTELSSYTLDQDAQQSIERSSNKVPKAMSSTSGSLTGDSDEGRYRTHPLYNKAPDADGLFRCPFKKEEPNCPHRETKLKCTYDKYVDSHLKPFRCKVDTCAKQAFSSTACLLRHEREAHGMHGHGERPHLCYYRGCERHLPGNGFPRRYNLFDHMKRVHDYRDDAVDSIGSPILGGETQKKIKGTKRKASSSPVAGQPPVQKSLAMHQQQQRSVMVIPPVVQQDGYYFSGYY